MMFSELLERNRGFTLDSARKFFNVASEEKGENLIAEMRQCFIHCKMTNLKDLENHKQYHVIVFVELLEMVARVAHIYWTVRE